MPIGAYWDNDEHTVIRYEFHGKYTSEEFMEALDLSNLMVSSVSHTVHFLVIIHSGMWIPPGVQLPVDRIYTSTLTNIGETLVVGASNLYKGISEISQENYRHRDPSARLFVKTEDDARAILNKLLAGESVPKQEDEYQEDDHYEGEYRPNSHNDSGYGPSSYGPKNYPYIGDPGLDTDDGDDFGRLN